MRLYGYIVAFLSVLSVVSVLGSAATDELTGLIHSRDIYAVSFDMEGDATVQAMLYIGSYSTRPVTELKLEFFKEPKIYVVLQSPLAGMQHYESYREQTYVLDYVKEVGAESTTVTVKLKEPIDVNKSAVILILYKLPELATRDALDVYSFEFKTIVDKQAILVEETMVNVGVPEDATLKCTGRSVDYKLGFIPESKFVAMAIEAKQAPSHYMKSSYEYVTGFGRCRSVAYNLEELESFTIKGKYSKNQLALNLFETIIVLLVIIAAIVVLKMFVLRRLLSHVAKSSAKMEMLKVSFLAAFAVNVLWYVLLEWLPRKIASTYFYKFGAIAGLYYIASVVLIGALIVGPAIYIGKKESLVKGLTVIILTLMLIVVIALTIIAIQSLLFPPLTERPIVL
jgi:hypothetical protein